MKEHLIVETVIGSNALPTGEGPAIFSTDRGQTPKRQAFLGQRPEVRSNRNEAITTTAFDLRARFPVECISIMPEDIEQQGPVLNEYFDNFDIYFYSPKFLWDVLLYIAKSNQRGKAERTDEVENFVNGWISSKKEAFYLITAEHQWHDLFTHEEIEEYGFEFLWDAFWKIAQIREYHDNAARLRHLHECQDREKRTAEAIGSSHSHSKASPSAAINRSATRPIVPVYPTASPKSQPPILRVPNLRPIYYAQRLHYQPGPASQLADQGSPSGPQSQRAISQGLPPRWQSISGAVPPISQAPVPPQGPQTFTALERIGSHNQDLRNIYPAFKTSRKDYHSDPIAQAWKDGLDYAINFTASYSAGMPGPFQYQRIPNYNRRFSFATSPRNTTLHRGFRNPPKQTSDDARRGSSGFLTQRDDQDPDLQTLRCTRQSRGQTSPGSPVVPRGKPRYFSNPCAAAMDRIHEEYEGSKLDEHSSIPQQEALMFSSRGAIKSELPEQRVPTQTNPQSPPNRQPLMAVPNAGSGARPQFGMETESKMWVGNIPLHLTQEQLHQLFKGQKGFLSVSEVKRNGNRPENDMLEWGWVIVNFRTPEDMAVALTTLPVSDIWQGQPLVAYRYKPKSLPYRNRDRHRSEGNIDSSASNHSLAQAKLPCDSAENAQSDLIIAQSLPSARTTSSFHRDSPSAKQELEVSQSTRILGEKEDDKPSDRRAQHFANGSYKGQDQSEHAVSSALTDHQTNTTTIVATKGIPILAGEGTVTKKKSKGKKKRAKDWDPKPKTDSVLDSSLNELTEPGKDLAKEFPPLTSSSPTFCNGLPSTAAAAESHIRTKTFAKAARQAASRIEDESVQLAPPKTSCRQHGELDGLNQGLSTKNGASCPSRKVVGKSRKAAGPEGHATCAGGAPDTECQEPASASLTPTSNCSMNNSTSSTPIPGIEFQSSQPESQSIKRTSSSSIDSTAGSPPAALPSTGATSHQQTSRRDSKATYEQPLIGSWQGSGSVSGVDPEHSCSRLQINALENEPTHTTVFEDARGTSSDREQETILEKYGQDIASTAAAPATPTLPLSSYRTPSRSPQRLAISERRNSVSKSSTPGPITTHKKSARQKGLTPTKQTFPSSSKARSVVESSPSQYRYPGLGTPSTLLVTKYHDANAVNTPTNATSLPEILMKEAYTTSAVENPASPSNVDNEEASPPKNLKACASAPHSKNSISTAKQLPSPRRPCRRGEDRPDTFLQNRGQALVENTVGAAYDQKEVSRRGRTVNCVQKKRQSDEETPSLHRLAGASIFGRTLAQKVVQHDDGRLIAFQRENLAMKAAYRLADVGQGAGRRDISSGPDIQHSTTTFLLTLPCEDGKLKQHLATALLLETKLHRLVESTLPETIVARGMKFREDCPIRQQIDQDQPLYIREQIAWNMEAASWIDSLPVTLLINGKIGEIVAKAGKNIEKQLQKINMDYLGAHLAECSPPGRFSSWELAKRADTLLRESPRLGKDVLLDPANMNAQMIWNIAASSWIIENLTAGRWTAGEKLPPYIMEMMEEYRNTRPKESKKEVKSPRRPRIPTRPNTMARQLRSKEPFQAMRAKKRRKVRVVQVPAGSDPYHTQLNAIEMVKKMQQLEKANQSKQTIIARISASENDRITPPIPKMHSDYDSSIKDQKNLTDNPKPQDPSKGTQEHEEVTSRSPEGGNGKGAAIQRHEIGDPSWRQKPFLASKDLYGNQTKDEYIYVEASRSFLCLQPLSVRGDISDHIPKMTPWGPTDMEKATAMVKKKFMRIRRATKNAGQLETQKEKFAWRVPRGEAVWGYRSQRVGAGPTRNERDRR